MWEIVYIWKLPENFFVGSSRWESEGGCPMSSHWGLTVLLAGWVDWAHQGPPKRRHDKPACGSAWFVTREHHGCLGHQRHLTGPQSWLPWCILSLLLLLPQPLPGQPERKVMVRPARSSAWCFLGLFMWLRSCSRGWGSFKWTPCFGIYGLPCL